MNRMFCQLASFVRPAVKATHVHLALLNFKCHRLSSKP
jgi:hypothetical protein